MQKVNMMILASVITILLVGIGVGAATVTFFSDKEVSQGNWFTAGEIDISINPVAGQDVVTLDGSVDLKPCETGYTTTTITNDGPNPAEIWKHITNVVNIENGITDAEDKYYAANSGSENWLISDWIHYDVFAYRSLGYSFDTTIEVDESGDYLVVTVTDGDGWVTWTFDFPVEEFTGDGNLNVGLIIALDGDGNGPAYQIHNNDGATGDFPVGTWLMSPWGPTIGDGWFGWHSGDTNTPVSALDWVTASGNRNAPHGDGVLEIKIKKSVLVGTIHWAASPTVGSGFFAPHYDVTMQIPTGFGWATPIVTQTIPNYIEATISELIKEIPEGDGFFLTGTNGQGGVASQWIYLGTLEPGESMIVVQSYHLDTSVDNWGQSDRVVFDMEFYAQQTEGDTLPPAPGPVLSGHGRP